MQNGKSRIKRVASAIIAGVMALQTVAPVISYADDTASSVATTDDSDAIANVDPGTPVQVDATASEEPSEAPSSGTSQADENSEETETNSDITDEVSNEHTDADTADETQTVEEDAPKQDESTSETTDTAPSRTVTVTLNKNGGEFEPEWLETANEDPIAAYLGTETNDIVVEDTGDTIVATVTDRDSIDIPVALSSDESLYFTGWDVSSGSYDADSETLTFEDGVDAYVLSAVYSSVVDDDQTLVENRTEFDEQTKRQAIQERLKSSGISTYVLRPSDSYNQLDLVVEGLAFTSDDGLTQTFTAPYDGDYIITAYGANGGTGKGKYQGYRTPGRGGKAEGTVHLNAGQTIHIYLGEAGGYWSTNRTFGGGGGQIDWDRAWFPDEDNGQTDRYHVFGRGGGATYVTVDAWTMDQAGEAAHDYTDAEKAQNNAAAEVAKKHVILLAGGGGGMGESGGSAGGGGLEGQGPVANRYYAGGFPPYSNAFSYDATVGGTTPTNGRTLTYEERVDAKVYPATQTRAGFGYHYTVLGELYDANPAHRDPVDFLFDDGQARNYGSFFYGANGITCSGAGGGGWFGGGTDYAFSGGGGSSFVNTSVTIDGEQVEVKDADYEVGGNMKYDSTETAPYLVNGRVIIKMVGETPKLKSVMMPAQSEDISAGNIDEKDGFGQKAILSPGQGSANKTLAYTAITYYNLGDVMTVTPKWEYNTLLNVTYKPWDDSVAKNINNQMSVSITNTELGIPAEGDKYYNDAYPGWYAVKSVMTITNAPLSMYDTATVTKYFFRCHPTATVSMYNGIRTMDDESESGGLVLDYSIAMEHQGAHVYQNRNTINDMNAETVSDTVTATQNHSSSQWKYPELVVKTPKTIQTFNVLFTSPSRNAQDAILYNTDLANQLGIVVTGTNQNYIFTKSGGLTQDEWNNFLRQVSFVTYDRAVFTADGVQSGVEVAWYGFEKAIFGSNQATRHVPTLSDYPGAATHNIASGSLNITSSGSVYRIVGSTTGDNRIYVSPGVSATVILDNVTMNYTAAGAGWGNDTSRAGDGAISCSHANLTIILVGTSRITAYGSYSNAIAKNGTDGSLMIDGAGTLYAVGASGDHCGAIGANVNCSFWNFTVQGGTIYANAGEHCPGIGSGCLNQPGEGNGGDGAGCGNLNFTGGTVVARGNTACSGIGSGWGGPVNGINISNGAKVTAYGGSYSPGIGSGGRTDNVQGGNIGSYHYHVRNIVITGGDTVVTAFGDKSTNMPGIGCGKDPVGTVRGTLSNVVATTLDGFQGYVRYGSSEESAAYSTEQPRTPFTGTGNIGSYLASQVNRGTPVYYTQVFFSIDTSNKHVDDADVIGTQVSSTGTIKPEQFASVSGTVWAENDRDGVYQVGDEAVVEGVAVTLYNADGSVCKTTTTNKYGAYSFDGIPEKKNYTVGFSNGSSNIQSYSPTAKIAAGENNNHVNNDWKSDVFTAIYQKNTSQTINCGVYVPSTVSGFAWDDVNQNGICDNSESKIANVTITLTDADGNSLTDVYGNPITAVLTDADGNYSFTNVRPRKEMKLTLTSSDTVDISNARVSPIPTSGDEKRTNKAERSIDVLEFNGAPTSATTEKSGSMLNAATIGEVYINSMTGTGITPVNAEYKNFALSANNSIRGYVWVESDYNGILDGWHETQADINIEEPVLNGVKVTLKNAAGATVATTYTDFAGYYEFLALKPGTYKVEYEETDKTAADKKVLPEEYDYFGFLVSPTATTDKKTQMGNDATAVMQNNKVAKAVSKTYQIPDTRVVSLSNEKDFYVSTANCAMYIPSKVYGYIWQDDNYNGIRETNETENVKTHIYLRRTTKSQFADADEQGTNISGHLLYKSYNVFGELVGNGDLNTAADGYYEYDYLEPGIYYVVFDNTYDYYGQTLINQGNDDTLDSETQPNISLDRSHMYCAWIGDIELPVNTKTEYNVLSKHNDAGFIRLLTSFDLKKVEDLSGIPFENVKFDYEIYEKADDSGKSVFPNGPYTTVPVKPGDTSIKTEHLTTDKNGLISFTNQDIATYHLTETETLPGYVRDTKTHVVKVMPETAVENNNLIWKTYISVDGVRQTNNLYTLKNTSETTNLTVTKKWDDANDQDGIRKNAVITLKGTVTLPDGKTEAVPLQKAYTALFKATDTYLTYTFRSIPAYYKGQTIQYTVVENPMDGYTAIVSNTTGSVDNGYAITVTNKHVPQFDDFTVVKVWDDGNNVDGIRPDSVTIHMNGSDGSSTEATLSNTKDWKYTFKHIPLFDANGNEITYTITEDAVAGYTYTVTNEGRSFTITNSHVQETLSIPVTKTWEDNGNQDGVRPSAIHVILMGSDGNVYEANLTAAGKWKYEFKDLPRYWMEGVAIDYTLSEETVDSYTYKIEGDADTGFTVTNEHIPAVTNVVINKYWEDAANQDGVRPDSVSVTLSGSDGKTYKATLTKDGGFSETFENLPVFFNNGTKIAYTVTEDAVAGYIGKTATDDTGYVLSITNTHTPETISKTITKTWDDNDNQDGIRPTNVKVELYGTDGTLRTQYLTKDNNWSYSFENLPKYQNEGTIILYTAKEEAVEGYTQKSVTTATGFNFTNTHEPQTVTYGATKVWLDDDNRDGVRPNSITLVLNGSDGSKYTKQMTAASNWSDVTFERIPMFNNGKYITYTLSENDVPSYVNSVAVSEDGKFFTVTNTHTPDHAIIKITEVWHDENDQDGIRPKKVTTIIVGSNGNRHEVPLHSSGDWHYTCDDLVKYWKNGQLVDYTVEAVTIDGYTSEVKSLGNNVFEVHNTHIPETISKTVTKTWKDNENQDGIRPASVTVTLTGSNAVSKTATLNEENGWTATFENLPKRDHGNIVTYNVKESDVEGYEASIVKTEDGFQLINEHDSETTLRTATLVWRDENNQDGIRPDTVTYTLHGSDGSEVEKTVSKDDSWADVMFEDLPVYQNGQKVTYTLTESTVDGYTTDIRDNGHTFTVTNTHIPAVVNVDVTKVWTDGENQDGNRPNSISVILTGNDGNRYTATITAANNWKYTFSKLPKFFNEGTQIEYTLAEDAASGYSNVIEKKDNYTFVLTNKYSPATVDIPVVKKWNDDNDRDGARPESFNIVLNGSDGKLYTGTLSAENGYTYVFQSVPKFHNSGTLISYTVAEEKVTGYTTEVAKDSSGYKFTLTNTKSIETVTKTVSKVWEDSNNQDGLRPSAITVILTGDDGSRYLKSVSAAENWTTTFENLPKNQNHGQSIQYTVSEAFVSGYTDEVTQNGNNYTITNTHMPATTELFVTKTWKDNGNNDGMRPDEITVTAHGSDGRSYAKKLNADNQWSVMFSNLPKYANGKTIDYTLTEEAVPGYTSSITRNGKSFTLINTHVDETKNITITKAWNDENNQDGLRPKSITAVVNGSDGSARFVQLFESQNWTTSLNNLPKYKNSTEVQYTVKENAISGYETEIKQTGDSYTITNTHAPAVVTVSVVKIWDDENNQDGIRPSLIQVTLTGSDGSTHNAAITKNDGWTYQFKDLPQYKNGVKIDYTLQEADSNPYTYEIVKGSDGYSFTITNNYVPAAVNVPVTTIWNDDNNRDGIRAKETVITLQGSNGKVYQHIVTDKDSFATVFEDVPKFFDEGKEVVYTVTQNEVDGYTTDVTNTDKYTFQITNTHEPEKLAKTVTKVWDDNNNQDGLRPNTLRIALTGTDGTYIEKNLSAANNWTETFEGLYKYFKEGTPIQYTIDEEAVGGYEKEISEKDNLITITNTHAPEKLDLIVNVVWNDANNQDGYRPDTTTIHMSGTDGTQDTKDFTKDSSWSSIVFKDLDRFKDGTKIKYTVTEDEIPQYTTSIVANGNVVTVTNTHIPEITLRNISVIWEDNDDQDGIRPDAVNIKLKGNDKLVDSSELNEDVKWKHSFTKLPVRENGNEISYTAEENEIPGYTTTIEKTDTGYVFTNTHIPETVTVTVDKVWDDSENQDGLRPDTIHIKLVSNGIAKDAYLDADSNWHLEFEGLPKYRDHGILNEYSVQEVDVDGYTSTVTTEDGYAFTIKNDHVPAVIDIPITEEWIDDNNRDGLRPSSHTVILTDGINTIEEIVLDKDNGYGTVLKDMPKYKNGVEIDYQIKDFKVDGYTTNIIKGDSVKDFKVTNTHVPEMVTVTVTEGWHDQSDYDKIRPEEIALTLTGSDGNVYEKTVNKETWTAVFSDLPKNSKGEQIIYTLTQEGIKGYSTTITNNQTDTITVINKHEPVKTITVTVTWNDENNKDSIRPDKVTVKLTDGTTVVSTKEVKNDSWKHIFEDIPVFNGSDKVSYTITQDAVNGYTTEIKASDDGNTIEIINTHISVVPPKEEPKKKEPATPAPVVEVKVEQPAPTVTLIQTTNKPTGISFFESLFAK